MFTKRHYQKIADMIGKASDLDSFYRLFVTFAKLDNNAFDVERFYNAVQKAHQFGGIGCGCPELAQ